MNKSISSIGGLLQVENLKVLYLQENRVNKIEGLDHLKGLTHLYLQHNNIEVIENLPRSLVKLYLGGHIPCISSHVDTRLCLPSRPHVMNSLAISQMTIELHALKAWRTSTSLRVSHPQRHANPAVSC